MKDNVILVIDRIDNKYKVDILYKGKILCKKNLPFANLIERKLTGKKVYLYNATYKNYGTSRVAFPSDRNREVYIDSFEAETKDELLDSIHKFSIGTDDLDFEVPLIVRVCGMEFTYSNGNKKELSKKLETENEINKKLSLEKK